MIQKNWQELIRPNKLQVTAGNDAARIATVVAEPLERGFGVTLGNALRRILLSSLQGAAVQSVHIDGVLHEFSSIAGVREDVTDIVLNIKDIAIKMQGEGPKRMVVKKQGPGTVTAGEIQTVGDVVVLNPDLILCTLDDGAEIQVRRRIEIEDQSSRYFRRIRRAVPRMQLQRGNLGDGDQSFNGIDLQVRFMVARYLHELEQLRHSLHPVALKKMLPADSIRRAHD